MQSVRLKAFSTLLLVFVLLMASAIYANGATVSNKQWQELTSDKSFGYKNEKEFKIVKQQNIAQNPFSKFIALLIAFFTTKTGKIIIWSIFLLLLCITLFKAFLSDTTTLFSKQKKSVPEPFTETSTLPFDVLGTNWESYLKQAIKEENFRLAIRYSYMLLLQIMQQEELINYRTDKTNYDYYYEINNTAIRHTFRQLTKQYEYTWYGNYPVQQEAYDLYMKSLESLKNQLRHS
ncbi:MAG TPA: hypothetical protein PL009_06340 [Flavipsychrobacter sp.]|nr:hypothetical protein [Flavipsychrobacter sp.]